MGNFKDTLGKIKEYFLPVDRLSEEVRGIFKDISATIDGLQEDNMQLRQELSNLEPLMTMNEYLKSYINSLSEATDYLVWGKNIDGQLIVINDKMRALLSEYSGLENYNVEDLVTMHEEDNTDSPLREIFMEDNIVGPVIHICNCRINGEDRVFRIRKVPVNNALGEQIGVCAAMDDITSRAETLENIKAITNSPRIIDGVSTLEDILYDSKQ